ncbi:head-tail connector protein [Roseicyclus mahoneyensis]|uniref:Putative phiE125 gp8 family phage protein n=1 Tax=Roseicyclus mahoneyensis TaxID=164332 RepID=A0A316GND9_9RHOB|nr:hypothetical protein [Roseicyclus mahoneyensis]PWK62158.1 putative phiE125 gp8 family phage protein [Roseicyclus mahoneyensis]
MMMVELTSVPGAALPVAELAEQLRLARGFSDDGSQDGQLESCLRAALSGIEARIGKALFERRFVLTLMAWHGDTVHVLPLAPVGRIDSVKLITRAGAETPVDPARYRLQLDAHRPAVVATGSVLPAPGLGGTIEVEFTAGHAAEWTGIPADLRQAVLILAGEFWAQNMDAQTGIPFAVSVLLEPHRPVRLRGAGQ